VGGGAWKVGGGKCGEYGGRKMGAETGGGEEVVGKSGGEANWGKGGGGKEMGRGWGQKEGLVNGKTKGRKRLRGGRRWERGRGRRGGEER